MQTNSPKERRTLFADIGQALLKSGLSETYFVAGNSFQHAGPFEVDQVLSNYEAANPGCAFELACLEYQATSGGSDVLLRDGTTFNVNCEGCVFDVGVALIGDKKFRFLYSKIDAATLNRELKTRVAVLEQRVERLSAVLDGFRNSGLPVR